MINHTLDIAAIRSHFPALSLMDEREARVYLDNPAGTQVPVNVLDRMRDYLIHANANHGGHFRTALDSDELLQDAHQGMADLLNAPSADEIIFGPNMTTLTFHISRSIVKRFHPGDEIILTRMDHDANVSPWVQAARDSGLTIRWLPFDKESFRFDLKRLEEMLSPRVRLVAACYASNALGTINDVKRIATLARSAGALSFIDAVQYVPHGPTDVQDIGCDFLACSAYKFFGPHQGILWGKLQHLEALDAYKVRPADNRPPGKFETGTQSHEGQAGTLGALEYFAWIGREMGQSFQGRFAGMNDRAQLLHSAMAAIKNYEIQLSLRLVRGLQAIPGVRIHGITAPESLGDRVPTVAFTMAGVTPEEIARGLAKRNVFVWDGDYYAVEVVAHLGLAESGGMVRVGAVHYNTENEIDTFVEAVEKLRR